MDCGATSLRIIAAHYGKHFTQKHLRELCHITRNGVSLLGISDAAEAISYFCRCPLIDLSQID